MFQPSRTFSRRLFVLMAAAVFSLITAGWGVETKPVERVLAATLPAPHDHVAGIPINTKELQWTPDAAAASQELYWGTDEAAVTGASAPAIKALDGKAARASIPAPLEYGKRYFWRVDDLRADGTKVKGPTWAFRAEDQVTPDDLTFYVVSDTHYGLCPIGDQTIPKLVDMMNWLPGEQYPSKIGGGTVGTPRGVLHIGDMTNDGKEKNWRLFVEDYGLTGHDGRLGYPVYEAFGNHDGGANLPVRLGIIERNLHRVGIQDVAANRLNYSWDWGKIHFINLGISVGTTTRPYDPENSVDFLVKDLAKNVGGSGRPVILLHHFGFDKAHSLGWWAESWRTKYYEIIRDYNVIGIIHGHAHDPYIYKWNDIDIFHPPHFKQKGPKETGVVTHGIFVFHITGDKMTVAQRNLDGTWGMTFSKSLPAAGAKPKQPAAAAAVSTK